MNFLKSAVIVFSTVDIYLKGVRRFTSFSTEVPHMDDLNFITHLNRRNQELYFIKHTVIDFHPRGRYDVDSEARHTLILRGDNYV